MFQELPFLAVLSPLSVPFPCNQQGEGDGRAFHGFSLTARMCVVIFCAMTDGQELCDLSEAGPQGWPAYSIPILATQLCEQVWT